MSKVETKADLLQFMEKHGACSPAFKWVLSRKEETFLEIWNACPEFDWLLWLMYKQDCVLADKWYDHIARVAPYSYFSSLELAKKAYRG